jgi:hypothetical protein
MVPIILLFGGGILVWIGLTDTLVTVLGEDYKIAPGYPNVPFIPFAVAAVLVTLPLALIKDSNEWAWKYVFLILVMAVVTNYEGIAKFTQDLSSFYGGSK